MTSLGAFLTFSSGAALALGTFLWVLAFNEREVGAAFTGTLLLVYAAWGSYLIYTL